jgi:transposase
VILFWKQEGTMGKPHPLELRERVVEHVVLGHSHRETARVFSVSVRFVNDMVLLKRNHGNVLPKPQGNPGKGKLTGHQDWVRQRISDQKDLTLDELRLELEDRGVTVHRSSVGRLLHRLGLSFKKNGSGQRTG